MQSESSEMVLNELLVQMPVLHIDLDELLCSHKPARSFGHFESM